MNLSSSVRGRTTILVTLVFALTLIVSGLTLLTVLRRTMLDNIDTALGLRAADLGALVTSGVAPRDITIPDDGTSFAQIILNGDVIASSTNVRGQPPVDMLTDSSQITVRQTSGDEEVFRLVVTEQNSPAGPVTIAVGTHARRHGTNDPGCYLDADDHRSSPYDAGWRCDLGRRSSRTPTS